MFVLCFAFVSFLHSDSVQSVRICGKRLADLLHFMCQHYGGFHSPAAKKSILFSRREAVQEFSVEDGQLSTAIDSGVVDECCRKQCTVATLISYCADGQYLGNLERLSELENLFSSNAESARENQMEEEIPSEASTANREMQHHVNTAMISDRPNLGTSTRNRPVFIVLPQVQEVPSSDMSTEDNSENSL
ncbi:putative insulin-like peptide 5 like protein [Argiope bruennichi]|uniref:Putative insulin-like peptide 5 like protein n=2 Tax=Argiope bruennichi TaxID=94029 RepID=A0A8T0FHW7_ARGBR|nr:putative insulin-like peptide 5 like protein [Argiope bruennichi]